ncbi:hypothetical protein F9C07_2083 [Aspergillus flavus]|uniref:Uncharacterized protein n=1 Tax=Aspergillus flavus (strain ATCC 200026 / FGSC A1120 / IAM 13836 / NRRL 3357 / JCM 12722 / SRRC 167) TaxID=332952 RepID=A0A7U2MG00_ASPFN|nr:hypothetical protein F9C07_2083 [Aspergillus flavus]
MTNCNKEYDTWISLYGGRKDHSLLLVRNMVYPQNLPTVVEKYLITFCYLAEAWNQFRDDQRRAMNHDLLS